MELETIKLLESYDSNVQELDISNCNIVGVLDLINFTNLKKVDCSNNQITHIIGLDIITEKYIEYFDCSNNNLKELNIKPSILREFKYENNPLETLVFPTNTKIHYPPTLKNLKLAWIYNKPIDDLPNTVITLEFSNDCYFSQPVDNLPNSLVKLKFGFCFNQPIDNLPNSITELILGCYFNQPIDYLPSSITNLILGDFFSQPIDNLPNSLIELTLGTMFNQPIDNLPNSLIKLTFYTRNYDKSLDNLPNSLVELNFYNGKLNTQNISKLPDSIQSIKTNDADLNKLLPEKYHSIISLVKKFD